MRAYAIRYSQNMALTQENADSINADARMTSAFGRALQLAACVLLVFGLWCSPAVAARICQIADPHDPTLNVRDAPGGTVVNRLMNDRVVRIDEVQNDQRGRRWAKVSGSYEGGWRDWGWVFLTSLKCINTDSLPRDYISVRNLHATGVLPQSAFNTDPLPISCDIVPNGWGVSISRELFSYYRERGFTEQAVCLGLGGDGVNFDPETGKMLKLYEVSGDEFHLLHPLHLPDCFKTVKILPSNLGYLVNWRPTGCVVRYKPETGFPISNPEFVQLTAGGEAGPGGDEDNQNSSVSEDRLRDLLRGK